MKRIKFNIYTIGSWGLALALLSILIVGLLKRTDGGHIGLATLSRNLQIKPERLLLEVSLVRQHSDTLCDDYSKISLRLDQDSAWSNWQELSWLEPNKSFGGIVPLAGQKTLGQTAPVKQQLTDSPLVRRQHLIWVDRNVVIIEEKALTQAGTVQERRLVLDTSGRSYNLDKYLVSDAAVRHAKAQIIRLANASCFDDFWDRTDQYSLPTDDSIQSIASGRISGRDLPALLGKEVSNKPDYRRSVMLHGGRLWLSLVADFRTTTKWDEDAVLSIAKPLVPFDSLASYHNQIGVDYRYLKASFQSLLNCWTSPNNNYLLNAGMTQEGIISLEVWSLKTHRSLTQFKLKPGQRICGIRWTKA